MKKIISLIVMLLISTNAFSKEILWDELKGLSIDVKTKKESITDALKKSISKEVTIRGFMMPLDFSSREVTEYLLMPYIPTCSHVPPPPANQLIFVKMNNNKKVPASFEPVEVKGLISVQANAELETAYKMQANSMTILKNVELPTAKQGHHQ